MKITNDSKICISIIVTGKCNCNCEYCHFYASHSRKEYNRNIESRLFNRYIDYIKYLQEIAGKVSVRFSGGEPLTMGDDLWKLTNKLYEETGIKPYIMTNGKMLNQQLILTAKKNMVSGFVVSIENPFEIIKGTERAIDTLNRIKACKDIDSDVPVFFGMLVVKNENFKNMYDIAKYFYNEVRMIPPMCEVNYLPYESPSDIQFNDLYENVKMIVKKYNGICDISLFPYIIPEFYSNNLNGTEYLTEFPIDDKHDMLSLSNDKILIKTEEQIDKSYAKFICNESNCDWYDSCNRIKWVWNMHTNKISKELKNHDYCKFKKTLSTAFYDALCEEN